MHKWVERDNRGPEEEEIRGASKDMVSHTEGDKLINIFSSNWLFFSNLHGKGNS